MEKGNRNSCICDQCVAACRNKPGWFKPGEVEKVAEFLGMSLQQLFNEKLQVDYWVGKGKGDIYNLTPGIIEEMERKVVPWFPHGTCVFLKDDRCEIHSVKPFECRETLCSCCDTKTEIKVSPHQEAGLAWNNEEDQEQVNTLLKIYENGEE